MSKLTAAFFSATLLSGISFSGIAPAADLQMRYKAPPAYVQLIFSWTGLYIGGHGGFAWGRDRDNQSTTFCDESCLTTDVGGDKFNMHGFVAGGHVGYNWQTGQYVFGVEGDADATGFKGSTNFFYANGEPPDGLADASGRLGLKSIWQASARLRAGYAFDQTLFYLTGGVAFAQAQLTETLFYDDDFIGTTGYKHIHVGWTFGGGIEHAFTPNWIGRVEARYSDFGKQDYAVNDGGVVSAGWSQVSVTGGLSYKF